jgi:methyl-accepting chemotaxis protein
MKIHKLKIGQRIALGLGVLIFVLSAVVAVGVVALARLHGQVQYLSGDRVPKLEKTSDWEASLSESARHARNALILDDREKVKAEIAALREARELRDQIIAWLQARVVSPGGKSTLAALQDARGQFGDSEERFAKLVEGGDMAAAKKLLLEDTRPRQLEYLKGIQAFKGSQEHLVAQGGQNAESTYQSAFALVLTLAGLALVLSGVIAYVLTRSVTRQLGGEPDYAAGVAREIAAGNLAVEVHTDGAAPDSLLLAIAQMRDSLAAIVGQVRQSTDSIATGTAQIAAGNLDLSGRTEQQASSLQQTAASMEQLTATVKQSADSARQANGLAASASAAAAKGGTVVGQVIATMDDIAASSKKIAEIINVIDGIAFQTNILALNAAVEAARAGDQGRGFAVVAGEVRNLAQRSAQAAREIKAMIGDSVQKVDAGNRLVNDAGESMRDIVRQVDRVTDLIAEITAAAAEQSSGIGQVNEAVTQMDQATQQNAALVEQSAAAATSLKDQAERLSQAVAVFKLHAQRAGHAPASVPATSVPATSVPAPPPRKARPPQRPPIARTAAPPPRATAPVPSQDWAEF